MRRREGSPKAELERRMLPPPEHPPTQKIDPPVLMTPLQKGRSLADPKERLGEGRGRIEDASPEDPGIETPHPLADSPPTGRRRGEFEESAGEPDKESPTRYPKGEGICSSLLANVCDSCRAVRSPKESATTGMRKKIAKEDKESE